MVAQIKSVGRLYVGSIISGDRLFLYGSKLQLCVWPCLFVWPCFSSFLPIYDQLAHVLCKNLFCWKTRGLSGSIEDCNLSTTGKPWTVYYPHAYPAQFVPTGRPGIRVITLGRSVR
jgi:hypothetical protein